MLNNNGGDDKIQEIQEVTASTNQKKNTALDNKDGDSEDHYDDKDDDDDDDDEENEEDQEFLIKSFVKKLTISLTSISKLLEISDDHLSEGKDSV